MAKGNSKERGARANEGAGGKNGKKKGTNGATVQVPATTVTGNNQAASIIPMYDPFSGPMARSMSIEDAQWDRRMQAATTDAEKRRVHREYKLNRLWIELTNEIETASDGDKLHYQNKRLFLHVGRFGEGIKSECQRRVDSANDLLRVLTLASSAIEDDFPDGFPCVQPEKFGFKHIEDWKLIVGCAALKAAAKWVSRMDRLADRENPAKGFPEFNESPATWAEAVSELKRLRKWLRENVTQMAHGKADGESGQSGHKSGQQKKSEEIPRPETPGFNEFDKLIREAELKGRKPNKSKIAEQVAPKHGVLPESLKRAHRRWCEEIADNEK